MTEDTLTLTDAQARVVSNWWHSGQSSAVYSFQSTGAILVHTLTRELQESLDYVEGAGNRNDGTWTDATALRALMAYVEQHGARGPQEGWHHIWDDEFENIWGE